MQLHFVCTQVLCVVHIFFTPTSLDHKIRPSDWSVHLTGRTLHYLRTHHNTPHFPPFRVRASINNVYIYANHPPSILHLLHHSRIRLFLQVEELFTLMNTVIGGHPITGPFFPFVATSRGIIMEFCGSGNGFFTK